MKKSATTPRILTRRGPTRGQFLAGVGGLLLLGGCGGTGGGGGEEGSGGTRTVRHKYGETEVSGVPERVVTVGFTDQDPVLALGVTPVAVREWFGEKPYAAWPWAQDELGGAEPEVLPSTELNIEQIAGLDPDLIVGVSSGMTRQEYDTLSEIAPTLAQSGEFVDFGVPWQEQTQAIGRALGRQDRAGEMVSELEARFARAREEHPEFEGASGVVVGLTAEDDSYTPSPYGPQDVRGRFMSSLGFRIPEEIADLAGDSFFADLSRERLGLIDTDVLVWVTVLAEDFEAVRTDPLYRRLDAAREGRDLFLEETLSGALSFGTVLSLPFLLDGLVPMLAAAVDGNPNTEAAS
ncbi:ABC transporter substrate-binding protein [Rubrobacter tropicus]|uniref:ABC transporter substrate-binding protein n=1 Tax=Rubrobacter tropicus TaxID=2653851 RepID=A0A6G8Q595_9ACTN|nr:iron-siderophore ABC transporter substrate-binding protein [Rubrobacter tropicus]QIN81664.1 ABC transporter substrate-binding protein [Rubrobacter tropicus]